MYIRLSNVSAQIKYLHLAFLTSVFVTLIDKTFQVFSPQNETVKNVLIFATYFI